MNTILVLVIGLLVGAGLTGVGAWFLIKKEKDAAQLRVDNECEKMKVSILEEQAQQQREKGEEISQLKAALQTAEARLQDQKSFIEQEKNEREKREQQAQEQEKKQMEMLEEKFKNISTELLKERQKDFKESSAESIEQTLKPLRDQIKKMSDDMLTHNGSQDRLEQTMKEQIGSLLNQTKLTAESADNLTAALKGQNKTQGDWGETKLVDVLKSLGYREGIQILPQEYIKDQFGRKIKDDEDSKMRPDVILKTDETHVVIIDAKMVLKDYMEYVEAFNNKDQLAMDAACAANTKAILNQVDLLAKQNYVKYITKPYETVEYTLMYVPVAGALRLAMENHNGLWHEAMAKKVLIVDEYSLAAMIRVIDITWSKIEQSNNTQRIIDTASTILERVEHLLETIVDAESAIQKAGESLGQSHALLTSGGTSIVTAANTLKSFGVHPKSKEYLKRLKKTAPIHEQLGESTETEDIAIETE